LESTPKRAWHEGREGAREKWLTAAADQGLVTQGEEVEGVIGKRPIHLCVQLAQGRAWPAKQTQLQARQQRQGQEPVRDLRQGTGWG
jgi:hypothetical protein